MLSEDVWRRNGNTCAALVRTPSCRRESLDVVSWHALNRLFQSNLTLTLTFDDGDMRHRTLYGASAGDPVGMISVDREAYACS